MRRLLSITLTLLMMLPLFAPVGTSGQQGRVAACCRRGGTHQCMEMSLAQPDQTFVRAVCPVFPRATMSVTSGVWSVGANDTSSAELTTTQMLVGQVEAGCRISSVRARQKRGPPVANS